MPVLAVGTRFADNSGTSYRAASRRITICVFVTVESRLRSRRWAVDILDEKDQQVGLFEHREFLSEKSFPVLVYPSCGTLVVFEIYSSEQGTQYTLGEGQGLPTARHSSHFSRDIERNNAYQQLQKRFGFCVPECV